MAKGPPPFAGMPESVKGVFGKLWSEVCLVHLYWNTFTQLYATDRIFLLNQFGALFFSQIRYLLITDVTLRLCKLTDPSEQGPKGRYKNQTIPRLIEAVKAADPDVAKSLDLDRMGTELSAKTASFREVRNRTIAHKEWANPTAAPLPVTTGEQVEQALETIRVLMNAIEDRYTGRVSEYRGFASNPGDAGFLLDRLQDLADRLDKDRESQGLPPYPRSKGVK